MVAYNLRKVENRDRYPDPPVASYRRNSLVAGLRVVAAAAWVRFPVSAVMCMLPLLPLSLGSRVKEEAFHGACSDYSSPRKNRSIIYESRNTQGFLLMAEVSLGS